MKYISSSRTWHWLVKNYKIVNLPKNMMNQSISIAVQRGCKKLFHRVSLVDLMDGAVITR